MVRLKIFQILECDKKLAAFEMTNRRLKAINGLWLGVALLLHSALLLVPISTPSGPAPVTEIVSVTLVAQSIINPPRDEPLKHQSEPIPETIAETIAETDQEIIPEREPPLTASRPKSPQQVDPLLPSTPVLSKSITTAQLLRSASNLKLPLAEKEKSLELGAFRAVTLPGNWSPSLKMEDNLFNGRVALAVTKIVDQWVYIGGGYNAVVKTRSGHTLCGQAQPWSPMNPLLEPVVMWRNCDSIRKRNSKRLR